MKKKIIIAAVVLAAVGAGLWFFTASPEKSKITYATATVTKGNLSSSITATGTIEPVTEVEVGTQVSGIIDKIYVDYNSVVHKGQLIAEMDKVTLQSELQSARALYNGNKADYEYQQQLYQRNKTLHDKQLISDIVFEETTYNYKRAKSSYEQSVAALAKAERNLSYATITSPIDGVVTSRDVEEGQTVASGFSTPTLFSIAADLTKMQVVANVDEADIADIQEGARVTFTVDAYPDDTFEGVVRQVRLGSTNSSTTSSSTATSSQSVVTYEVVITADNPDLKLKPRLTANANIYTVCKEQVLTIPNKALRFTPNPDLIGDYTIRDVDAPNKVWTLEGKIFTAHAVQIGVSDGTRTEVLGGIAAGTRIVTEAVAGVADEMADDSVAQTEKSPFMPQRPSSNRK